jgi:hypothetical protein
MLDEQMPGLPLESDRQVEQRNRQLALDIVDALRRERLHIGVVLPAGDASVDCVAILLDPV